MAGSYAVIWREDELPSNTGKLELRPTGLLFEGASRHGRTSVQRLRYDDVASVWIARGREDRIQGRPILLLERRSGGLIRIGSLNGPGTIRELADSLGAVASGTDST